MQKNEELTGQKLKKCLTFTLLLYLSINAVTAQTQYILDSHHEFTVNGTSNLHDWTMSSKSAEGKAIILIEKGMVNDIANLTVQINVESLKSGKKTMDNNAYEALRSKKFPAIHFKLNEIDSLSQRGDSIIFHISGELTLAGITKTIKMDVASLVQDNHVYFEGEAKLKMTDYNIEPPAALFGTLKTGDEVSVSFSVLFKLLKQS